MRVVAGPPSTTARSCIREPQRGQRIGSWPNTRCGSHAHGVHRLASERSALIATERGAALIDAIPAEELKSPELTGRWEKRLADMADGRDARQAFMDDVRAHVARIVKDITEAPATHPSFAGPKPDGEPIGACPRCSAAVIEGRPVYRCVACEFVVFKTMSGRAISRRMVATLLKQRRAGPVKGFKSQRTGKSFSAGLEIREDGSVGLWFPEAKAVGACPRCEGGTVRSRGKVYGCDGEGCEVHIFRTMSGREISEAEVQSLLFQGRTAILDGFVSRRTGKTFAAGLQLDESGKGVLWFPDRDEVPERTGPAVPMPTASTEEGPAGRACPACGEGDPPRTLRLGMLSLARGLPVDARVRCGRESGGGGRPH